MASKTVSVAFCVALTLVLCEGACTVSSLLTLQTTAFDSAKLDGHWYVTHTFGDTSNYTSYTVDVVPVTSGITLYINQNISGETECTYKAVVLNSATEARRFVTPNGASSPRTVVVAATNGNFGLIYFCDGVATSTDDCTNPEALVVAKQSGASAAAASWLDSVTSDPPCFENVSPIVVQQGSQECPFKSLWGLPGKDCSVNSFPVQENFDLNKYLGKWYEMSWLAMFYIPPEELFNDYYHNYTLKDDENVTISVVGRNTDDKCFYRTVNLLMTNTLGRMIFDEPAGPTPYNVAVVDYDKYAVVYGCRNISQTSGECLSARSWLWSRDKSLDRPSLLAANAKLQDLCFNPSSFLTTRQTNECPKEKPTGSGSAVISSVLVMSLLTLLSVVIGRVNME